MRANAISDLADVLGMASQPNEAADALATALDLYEQKGNLVMAKRTPEAARRTLVTTGSLSR
jgi:hypothetical protein